MASEGVRVNVKTLIKRMCVITGWRNLKHAMRNNSKNLGIEKGKLNWLGCRIGSKIMQIF
jgi:hypothetical protein